jgi:hypothetical protein
MIGSISGLQYYQRKSNKHCAEVRTRVPASHNLVGMVKTYAARERNDGGGAPALLWHLTSYGPRGPLNWEDDNWEDDMTECCLSSRVHDINTLPVPRMATASTTPCLQPRWSPLAWLITMIPLLSWRMVVCTLFRQSTRVR